MLEKEREKFKQKLEKNLLEYTNAMVDLSWKGSKGPEEFEDIEEAATTQKEAMIEFVMDLFDERNKVEIKTEVVKTTNNDNFSEIMISYQNAKSDAVLKIKNNKELLESVSNEYTMLDIVLKRINNKRMYQLTGKQIVYTLNLIDTLK